MTRLPIDIDYLRQQLLRFLAIPSPVGYTDQIVRIMTGELERLGLEVELNRRGAIRARLAGERAQPARALVGHLDTLGAQTVGLKDNGRLAIRPTGTWSARFAEGARATIFTEAGAYRGSILPLKASGHAYDKEVDQLPIGWDYVELRVDAFARGALDLTKLGFAVGDLIAIDPQPELLDNGFIVSRHLDNKAGCAALLAALKALRQEGATPVVDTFWIFSISEEVGVGASSVLTHDIAAMVAVDNGVAAPTQNSEEFGVTIAMGDETGPFDWHMTKKLVSLCRDNDIRFQRDVFRYYRSDSASAIEAGADVRTALITFGVDASHGYERIHMHALRSVAELITAYVQSPVEIMRDAEEASGLTGFTTQPMAEAEQELPVEARLVAARS